MPATVTAKGQITIPKAVREALGVKPGSKVEFKALADGTIAIVKQGKKPEGRFDRFRGVATTTLTTEEIMALTPGMGLTVLVDSNVLLDVITSSPEWYDWSVAQLNGLAISEELAINDIVFAEISPSFQRFEDVSAVIEDMGLRLRPMPHAALFLAAKVHRIYRRVGGAKESTLPDFFIGAQAAVEQLPLLTRDVRRFRTYFPALELITP